MTLPEKIDPARFKKLVHLARDEDFGAHGDMTTALLPSALGGAQGSWNLTARQHGRFCGQALLPALLAELAPEVRIVPFIGRSDGSDVTTGDVVARFSGLVSQMLTAERTLLNFIQRLSGIATLAHRFVAATAGTHAKIYDTRKTIPGWRDLERYAVRAGGGHNHRAGLHDAVLIKDNHLVGIPTDRLAHAVFAMLNRLGELPAKPAFVEVEVDSLAQLTELLKVVGIDVILLDNFDCGEVARAVAMRDAAGLRGKIELEASGGVTLETVAAIARTGVERIAVGALTHSAVAMDFGLDAV